MNLSRIVCAIDDADTSRAVLTHAVAIARWQNADLHVVRVVDTTLEQETSAPAIVASEQATTLVVHVGIHVTAGATDVHILAEARRLGADLIVMGLRPRAGANRALPGSMVGRVAAQANCPVLVHKAFANSPTWERRYPMPSGHVDQSAGEASRVHVSLQPAGDA